MTFRVHLQYPKPKDMGLCCVSLERSGTALLLSADGQKVITEMTRARVEWIQSLGLTVSGMQTNGYQRDGRMKYQYQEWFCAYVEDGKCSQ